MASAGRIFGFLVAVVAMGTLCPLFGQSRPPRAVIHLAQSPYAKIRPVPASAVTIDAGFWKERRRVTADASIPSLLELLESHGIVDNFRRLSGRKQVERRGPLFTDSDIYKWIEAAAFSLQWQPNPELKSKVDGVIDDIVAAQEPSGYLNTWFQGDRKKDRWQQQYTGHELYCLGHLLQAALAYEQATGDRKLLEAGIRFVNHLIDDVVPGGQPLWAGHPEIEMALIELYRAEADKRFLDLARYILAGERERLKISTGQVRYTFSGKPFTERTEMEGHAVRACYASAGATDYFLETGDSNYWRTLTRLWQDMTERKMYVTGGVGSRASGETFGEPFELPNSLAYSESCAAISNMMWSYRMLHADPQAKYADVMERALYNSVNSGMSLSGTLYCYRNPLQLSGNPEDKIRNPWYGTTCCPPNLQRTFASLSGYLYSTAKDALYVHHFASGTMRWQLEDGSPIVLQQQTDYPFQGKVRLRLLQVPSKPFSLFLRVPGWSASTVVKINDAPQPSPSAGEYAEWKRTWKQNDVVEVDFDMTPQVISANPLAKESTNSVAVQRGPLVYVMEQLDQPFGVRVEDAVLVLSANPKADFRVVKSDGVLGGIPLLKHHGAVYDAAGASLPLYAPLHTYPKRKTKAAELTLVPYYTFHNRGETAMQVWIPFLLQ